MTDRLYNNPSGFDMPKPTRFLLLDDLSDGDFVVQKKARELTSLVDADCAIYASAERLLSRVKRKNNGLLRKVELCIGIGKTGYDLAERIDTKAPIVLVTPYRETNSNGANYIKARSGKSLLQEIRENLPHPERRQIRNIGLVDDTVFSGGTVLAIVNAVRSIFSKSKITVFTLTYIPSLSNFLEIEEFSIVSGLTLRSDSRKSIGINSVDVKDLVLQSALPLADGRTIPFMEEENWMRAWFGKNYERAIEICLEIKKSVA